ncbi:MAG: hypothetical protein BGO95_00610 [Micrococcales bacterium 73-13]|nr:MAG: hypothetical protein BGO95_00610 [Micrococcales bacterium 73-13]
MIEYLAPWWPLIASGLLNTVLLAAAIAVLSTILAIAVSLGLVSTRRWLAVSCRAYVEIFRSVPALVLLMLMYFGLGEIVGALGISAFWVAVIALSVNQSAYTAESYRAAIESVSRTQWDAARAIGLSRSQAYRLVVLPQAVTPAIAPSANALVMIVKDSALASIITVPELVLAANRIIQTTFQVIPTYVAIGVVYLLLTVPLIYVGRYFEQRVARRRATAVQA